ncbi:uncharacterized protein STEHIDRAFT_159206 [Stereum hirsutum FP-91666 SS1]|uniref:uncharacterized protein n=1 Tax=Stereum hirsutum (strain FP-91666) TaxID=721885 RepID=UPI00044499E7|nr:uncharacterized protein STEHIDRAFT_159206 [Stereum hirsutum FP-91666 SS1]EIM84538.1 hypothetical protein STEHIDRAFT_159206 [Stereum hirsutum FP-91666 SS1]
MRGRRKKEGTHYYPAHTKPKGDYDSRVPVCNHPDVSLRWFSPTSSKDYDTLLNGLDPKRVLGIPGCFTADLMHLAALNLPDLLISLWRGTIGCDETDSKRDWPWLVLVEEAWKRHGQLVGAATPYFPGSFGSPPCNIAEKLTSGYKA